MADVELINFSRPTIEIRSSNDVVCKLMCKNKCEEFNNSYICEKNYHKWYEKSEKCKENIKNNSYTAQKEE